MQSPGNAALHNMMHQAPARLPQRGVAWRHDETRSRPAVMAPPPGPDGRKEHRIGASDNEPKRRRNLPATLETAAPHPPHRTHGGTCGSRAAGKTWRSKAPQSAPRTPLEAQSR